MRETRSPARFSLWARRLLLRWRGLDKPSKWLALVAAVSFFLIILLVRLRSPRAAIRDAEARADRQEAAYDNFSRAQRARSVDSPANFASKKANGPAVVSQWTPELDPFPKHRLPLPSASAVSRSSSEYGRNRVAVLVPFVDTQLPKLTSMLNSWTTPQGFPCALNDDQLPLHTVSFSPSSKAELSRLDPGIASRITRLRQPAELAIVFFYEVTTNTTSRLEVEYALNKLWLALGDARLCFTGGVHFRYAALPPEENTHFSGACAMFYKSFSVIQALGCSHFLLMEPDVSVLRPYWLDALAFEADQVPCADFWQKGSPPICHPSFGQLASRVDNHSNGNAIYCASDERFDEYRARVRAFYPGGGGGMDIPVAGCVTGDEFEDGYDHCMYRFRMHPVNRDYALTVLHKFHYTPFILNLCEDDFSADELRARFPDSFLVHSKAVFRSQAQNQLRKLYVEVLNAVPNENAATYRELELAFMRGTLTKEDALQQLCLSADFLSRYRQGHREALCETTCSRLNATTRALAPFCHVLDEERQWKSKFPGKYYVWCSDFHAAPIVCNREIYEAAGAVVHAEIDFGNCMYHEGTCKQRLKVLAFDNWRGFSLDPCPNRYRRRFFHAYRDDGEMKRVDFVICSHPAANCELYMPLNRSLVIYPTTRLEFGRFDDVVEWRRPSLNKRSPIRWAEWVSNLIAMSKQPHVILAANNLFDVHYVRYHTGLQLDYLPSWCDLGVRYTGGREGSALPFLLAPYRDNLGHPYRSEAEAWNSPILRGLQDAIKLHGKSLRNGKPFDVVRMGQYYPKGYKFEEIAAHPAVVFMPYQVSVMSFFELYRAGIPIFAPSKELLIEWTRMYNFTWERIYGHPRRIVVDPSETRDPTSDDENDLNYWLGFCDIYVFPHITYFSSWGELLRKLDVANLDAISNSMHVHNANQRASLVSRWKAHFERAGAGAVSGGRVMPRDFDEAMLKIYGIPTLGPDPPGSSVDPQDNCF